MLLFWALHQPRSIGQGVAFFVGLGIPALAISAPVTGAILMARWASRRKAVRRGLSQREVAREARTIFPNAVVPKDFDTIDVRFQERGGPELVKGGALHDRPEREIVPTREESPE